MNKLGETKITKRLVFGFDILLRVVWCAILISIVLAGISLYFWGASERKYA